MTKPLALLAAAGALLALPASASATFPGTNGDLLISNNTSVSWISADGARTAPVVPTNGTYGAPSPDGTQIAYTTRPEPANHITIANADGSEATPVTNAPANARDHSPAWSPDGSKIAFSRVVGGKGTIWVINADGTGLKQLTDGTGVIDQDDPSWSPDGTRIAYVTIGDGSVNGAWWMNADGSSQTREAPTASGNNPMSIDWSPDGTSLAFTVDGGASGSGGIYVKQVGSVDAATRIRPVDFADGLTYSPDGTRLAYASQDEANNSFEWDVYTVASDGLGQATRLTGPSQSGNDDYRNAVNWAPVAPPAPGATTNAASGLSTAGATLNGTVNPHGGATSCRFEYGASASYGSSIPCSTASLTGSSDQAVSAALSSLQASTTYHYRVVARKGGQTARGADQTLTTSAPAPEQTTPAATPTTSQPTKAVLPLPDVTTPAEAKAAALTALGDLTRGLAKAGTAQLAKGVVTDVVVKEPGTYVMGVYAAATNAKASAGKRKLVLLASGRKAFAVAGKGKVRIKATAKGRTVLKRAKKLKVVIRTTFTPAGGKAVVSERSVTLKKKTK